MTVIRLTVSFVVLLALLFVTVDAQQRARRPKVTTHHRTEQHKDHSMELMPDVTDHAVMQELRCSSCQVIAQDVFQALQSVHNNAALKPGRNPKPSRHELVSTLDDMCTSHHTNKYGLVVDPATGKSTTAVSASTATERVHGLWLNQFMKHRCGHLLVHQEESILEHYASLATVEAFQQYLCVDWEHSCEGKTTKEKESEALQAKKHEKRFGKRASLSQTNKMSATNVATS